MEKEIVLSALTPSVSELVNNYTSHLEHHHVYLTGSAFNV